MGFIFGDLVLETILKDGLEDMKANADIRLAVLYEQLKDNYLDAEYGQAELDKFKLFILNNKIDIVQSWRMIEERTPCICIQMVNAEENIPRAVFNDYAGEEDIITMGHIDDRKEINEFVFKDHIQISIHVGDPAGSTALRWLYAAVIYFLLSRKSDLENRGLELVTASATDFNRLNEYLPENIYSRYITYTYDNTVSWTKRDSETILDTIDLHGGPGASAPGEKQGGIKIQSGRDSEYEEGSVYTIDEE